MPKPKLPDEFSFEKDSSNGGVFRYRDLFFTVICNADYDEMTERECAFWDVVIKTLNDHYPRLS